MEYKQIAKYNNYAPEPTTTLEGSISESGHFYTLKIDNSVSDPSANITRIEARALVIELERFISS